MRVELRVVPKTAASVLSNLMQLYCHDLSVYFGLELGVDGRFDYPQLPLYFTEPEGRHAFFVEVDGKLAGFVLATRGSPAHPDPSVFDVAEFFVLRTFRRSGVGVMAASALWDRLPGTWVVRAAANNEPAVAFWRRTVAAYAGARPTTEATRTMSGRVRHVFTLDSGPEVRPPYLARPPQT